MPNSNNVAIITTENNNQFGGGRGADDRSFLAINADISEIMGDYNHRVDSQAYKTGSRKTPAF
jgi:hypothetical protein